MNEPRKANITSFSPELDSVLGIFDETIKRPSATTREREPPSTQEPEQEPHKSQPHVLVSASTSASSEPTTTASISAHHPAQVHRPPPLNRSTVASIPPNEATTNSGNPFIASFPGSYRPQYPSSYTGEQEWNDGECRDRADLGRTRKGTRGAWSSDEDRLLIQAVQTYGSKWSLVAGVVKTRSSTQCARRWSDTLDPRIDKSPWTTEQDQILLQAVVEHGRTWASIAKHYFPGRTGLALKNRYTVIGKPSTQTGGGLAPAGYYPGSHPQSPEPQLLSYWEDDTPASQHRYAQQYTEWTSARPAGGGRDTTMERQYYPPDPDLPVREDPLPAGFKFDVTPALGAEAFAWTQPRI